MVEGAGTTPPTTDPPPLATEAEPIPIPAGYHEALVTAITVLLTFSLGFVLFWTIQPESGEWTPKGFIATIPLGIGTGLLLFALRSALSLKDDLREHYDYTVTLFSVGVLFIAIALVAAGIAMAQGAPAEKTASPCEPTPPAFACP
jgi:hypothetical protein